MMMDGWMDGCFSCLKLTYLNHNLFTKTTIFLYSYHRFNTDIVKARVLKHETITVVWQLILQSLSF